MKEKSAMYPFWRELLQFGIYKRSQGRITRQITFAVIALVFAVAAWRLSEYQVGASRLWQFGIPVALGVIGVWLAYRIVNMPAFADFLIAVEAEMNKVSWPTRHELIRSVIVVIISIAVLTTAL